MTDASSPGQNSEAARRVFVRAPARVNLIGEHTDYNMGFCLPVALQHEIVASGSRRDDDRVTVYAQNFDETVSFAAGAIRYDAEHRWANYVKGVVYFLAERGLPLTGMNIHISGDIPAGAGLSSSAALEVATALLFEHICGFTLAPVETAKLCQRAENEFVGMRCGLMDQFACCLGRKGHALFLDCRSEEYEYVPLDDRIKIVVCNTGIGRELAGSRYNTRRSECEEAVRILKKVVPGIQSIRDIDYSDFKELEDLLPPTLGKRCEHVISENLRVVESADALREADYERLGKLLIDSHRSLRDKFEVSCRELDVMVEAALSVEGVLGAKMTGAGFGGCTVNLVDERVLGEFERTVIREYLGATGIRPEVHICESADGAGIKNG